MGDASSGDQVKDRPGVGDLVQWESNGVAQFETPRQVTGLSDDGQWVFTVGSPTGLPIAEVSVANKAGEQTPAGKTGILVASTPPPNPNFKPPAPAGKQDVFDLRQGRIVVEWPETLGADEIEDVEEWFPIVLRKIKRSVRSNSAGETQ